MRNLKIYISLMKQNFMAGKIRLGFTVFMLALLTFPVISVSAQEHTISGTVRDAHTKKPLEAARIMVINEKVSAITDESGKFSLRTTSPNAVLIISAIEYNSRAFPLQGTSQITADLYPGTFSNYYLQTEGVTGSVLQSVLPLPHKTKLISSLTNIASPDDLLQTEFGGDVRTISRSGTFGMGSSVFIRGLNSLNANAQPLFVVDGVVWNNLYNLSSIHQGFFTNVLTNIDVTDIESITLMKDGNALFGSKGSNGVVFIKTKRGIDMATKINLNIVTGFTASPKPLPLLDASQHRIYVSDMVGTAGFTNAEVAQLPYLNDNPARSTYKTYHNETDWQNEIYRTGVTTNYAINVNGGDDKALYYFALSYTNNNGTIKESNFSRYNVRLNADVNVVKDFKMGLSMAISNINRKLFDDGINSITSPTWMTKVKSPFLSPYTFTSMGEKTSEYAYADIFGVSNPGGVIRFSNNTLKEYRFNVALNPELKINQDFKLKGLIDYNLHKINEDYYRPYLYAAPVFVQRLGNSYNERQSQVIRNNSIFTDVRLEYNKQFSSLHKLSATLGVRYNAENFESDYVEGHNSKSNSSINLVGGFKNLLTDGYNSESKLIQDYLSADYSYDNRYFVNAAVSVDGSSRFGNRTEGGFRFLGQTFGVFPSINASWLVTSEKFMKPLPFVSLLKIRTGYSVTGNDDIRDYLAASYFSAIRLKGVANGMIIANIANPRIQWETTNRLNAGTDIGLFNDRLNLSFDIYSATTNNLLYLKSFQDVAGLDAYWNNGGKLANSGYEFSASAKMLHLKNFTWELGLSVGHYSNKITHLPDGNIVNEAFGADILTREGEAACVFYGYKTLGVFATEQQAESAALKMKDNTGAYTYFSTGDIIFDDKKTDGIIDQNDRQIIGNPNPDIYGTFSNKFSYKNLSLNVLFAYSLGNDVYNYQRRMLESSNSFDNQTTAMLSRWTNEGQNTTQPRAVYADPMGNARFSDRWIEDGSFLRLKSVSLDYNLPLKSNFIEGINLWLSAGNVFTLSKYLGVDPETSVMNGVLFQGIDAGLLPLTPNYNIGIKLQL